MINAYAPTSIAEDEKVENFTMILKEQWLLVTPNIELLQEISMQKMELKQKKKTSRAWEHFGLGERNERGDRLIEFAEEHNLIIANLLFQKQKNDTGLGSHQMGKQGTK